jgi:hypothetical protein
VDAAPPLPTRGLALIIEHCTRLNSIHHVGPTGKVRLNQAIGDELARLLLSALVGDHHARTSAV